VQIVHILYIEHLSECGAYIIMGLSVLNWRWLHLMGAQNWKN